MYIQYYSQDEVAVYAGFSQVFKGARPTSVEVSKASKLMEHAVEDGTPIVDHKVDDPVTITIGLTVAGAWYRDLYAEISQLFREGKLLTVQTRAASYTNQVIQSMPHKENTDGMDVVFMTITTKQVRIVAAQTEDLPPSKTRDATQSSTQNNGEVPPKRK